MFHHFYDDKHPRGQGAINAAQFEDMLSFLGRDRILDADDWLELALQGKLEEGQICLTFDDALLCQYDVAVPVMRRLGIKAFFFVYSSVFQGGLETLEIYRYFRTTAFDTVDSFYDAFLAATERLYPGLPSRALEGIDIDRYLADFPFYSRGDRIFRYIRDNALPAGGYDAVMNELISDRGFDKNDIANRLWMTNQHLLDLKSQGHLIGLHSYSHPLKMERLPNAQQAEEYGRNHTHLTHLLGSSPVAMSHPCNSYNDATLDLLGKLGIRIGFCANMSEIPGRSTLQYARQDHANILAEMQRS
jgi:peptidoglycan/xylan/chitin deacetylase (PgdA/CDA1 family)